MLVFLLIGGGTTFAQTSKSVEPTLTLLWETEPLLNTVESVIYDPQSELIYTANIHGHFMNKDGNGYISKVGIDGKVIESHWITGLDAPTGLGIYKGKLYTTDIDQIIEIELATGKILKKYPVEGAKAFNDIAIGPDGTVYGSDTGGNQIFTLKGGKVELWQKDIDTPNGLLVLKGKLLVTQWNPKSLGILDLASKHFTQITDGIAGPDGVEVLKDGSYWVSGFDGRVYHVNPTGAKTLVLDTTKEQVKAADIDYIAEKKLLLVPTMSSHKVMAYQSISALVR